MKRSLMNIKNFVLDSNVMQRIDRVAHNNNDFFGEDLLLIERQFEELKNVCVDSEKRISALLQTLSSSATSTLVGTYTQNVHASLSNLTTSPQPSAVSNVAIPQNVININDLSSQQTPTSKSTKHHFKSIHYQHDSISINNDIPSSSSNHNNLLKISNHPSITKQPNVLPEEFRKHKKLPIIGYLKFLTKSNYKLKPDSTLATTFSQCSKLQTQLIKLYLAYEQKVEIQCLKPIQQLLEVDIPNIMRLRKLFIKSHNDLESITSKYNGANQKQQQIQLQLQQQQSIQQAPQHHSSNNSLLQGSATHQAQINKIEHLKKEMDETFIKFEQAKDTYAAELYAFVCKETDLVRLFRDFYQFQTEYHQQVALTIQGSLPPLDNILVTTPRKCAFGLSLNEHLSHTGRSRSLVIDLCIHLLYANALNEEGLFRIPGSSIKIKNLKNAINAWFVILASQNELASDAQSFVDGACSPSVVAIYNLFKHVVSRQPLQTLVLMGGDNGHQGTVTATIGQDTSNASGGCTTTCNTTTTSTTTCNNQLVFDVHTIAGLLKLYLRELPEPLFTHALYKQFIDVTLRTLKNEPCESSLKQLISKLPRTNYENLRHLIRFLHLLTCYSDQNKMTAANLAITMAPSLIWAQPQVSKIENDNEQPQMDDVQTLNMQMCNVGISASLHAKVIESLIINATDIFPGTVEFSLPEILNYEESLPSDVLGVGRQDRSHKSASPTGLSTASSSSFSSTSSKGKHNRKVDSMEGLMNDNNITLTTKPQFNPARPLSVNLNPSLRVANTTTSGNSVQKPAPPVPPAPVRSHLRNTCDQLTHRTFSSHQKPPAPPPPPSATTLLKRAKEQQLRQHINDLEADNQPLPHTMTGHNNINSMNSTRPNVPPPDRPNQSSPTPDDNQGQYNSTHPTNNNQDKHGIANEIRSLSSPTESELRTDFETNSADDDIDISVSVSPAASFSSGSQDDIYSPTADAQFSDNIPGQLGESSNRRHKHDNFNIWARDVPKENEPEIERGECNKLKNCQKAIKPIAKQAIPDNSEPPAKPPRSASPKVTQSTPL